MGDPKRGLYNMFFVERCDGTSEPGQKHHGCDYFVLDLSHDKYAKPALRAYADACESEYPLLARDLRAKFTTPVAPQADPVREKDYGICDCPDPQSCNEQCAWSTWSTRFQKPSEGRQAEPVREEREK